MAATSIGLPIIIGESTYILNVIASYFPAQKSGPKP
jgi:hypothetical protein